MKQATAFAPASIGNVAVGFDVLGCAMQGAGDRAHVTRNDSGRVTIERIEGVVRDLPLEPASNTAGRALLALAEKLPGVGFSLALEKGIALGSGMGGSAASAVAALVAANATLDAPLPFEELYELALCGEEVASGSKHGDNVAPSLLGGLVIAPTHGLPVRVPTPPSLWCALCHPHFVLATRDARAALKGDYALPTFVEQSEGLALVLAGCYSGQIELIARGLRDVLVEPRRSRLIPGFASVKQAALDAGALGSSISGAGPSVFAWCEGQVVAQRAVDAMARAFEAAGLASDSYVSPVSAPGARVE